MDNPNSRSNISLNAFSIPGFHLNLPHQHNPVQNQLLPGDLQDPKNGRLWVSLEEHSKASPQADASRRNGFGVLDNIYAAQATPGFARRLIDPMAALTQASPYTNFIDANSISSPFDQSKWDLPPEVSTQLHEVSQLGHGATGPQLQQLILAAQQQHQQQQLRASSSGQVIHTSPQLPQQYIIPQTISQLQQQQGQQINILTHPSAYAQLSLPQLTEEREQTSRRKTEL